MIFEVISGNLRSRLYLPYKSILYTFVMEVFNTVSTINMKSKSSSAVNDRFQAVSTYHLSYIRIYTLTCLQSATHTEKPAVNTYSTLSLIHISSAILTLSISSSQPPRNNTSVPPATGPYEGVIE